MQRYKIQNNTDSMLEGSTVNYWNDLSIQEKAAMMDVAIRNGITDLKDIRDKYNEFAEGGDIYPSEEVNEFGGGGYKPSERIKKRISNWEGAAMYKDTIDPLSGKMAKKNAPFETVTSGFVSVLPSSIREQVLSNQELADNLFSYAYNVGPGRFKERVVPTLIKYYSGQATANDIAQSMWASGDAKLRGLRNRRAEERAGVLSALGANPVAAVPIPETTVPAFMPSNPQAFFNPIASYTPSEVVVPMETESPLATYDPEELKRREQAQYRNNFTTMMSLLYPQDNSIDLLSMLTNNSYSKGGSIHIDPSKKDTFTAAASKVLANKDNYSPAMVKKANFARNFGGKKHSYGGNLFDDGGNLFVKYVDSYRVNPETGGVYDKTGEIKEGAVILPEVEVIGKPLGKEAIRREADRMRAIQGKQGLSGVDPLGQFVVETAALSPVFKGLEVAGLYGLGRYGEAITGFAKPQNWARGKLISDAMERSLTKPVTATVSPEITNYWSPSLSTPEEASSINLGDVLNPTTIATERGRTKYLDWINSPSYRQRLQEEPLYKYTDYILDRINKLTNNLKFKYDKNLEQLSEGHSGIVAGETTTKPAKVLRDDGNYRIFDLNTGLDINIANDLGEDAEDTAVHELLHYITANSKGIPEDTGLQTVVDKGWANPLEILYGTSGKNIQRGDKWQSYILDQNNSLLPEYDQVVNMVMKNPQKAKEYLIKAGRTESEAIDAVNRLRDRYSYWSDIQEQRAHLQELFISKIKPNIKNPNDAAEVENYLLEHPEILENSAPYKYIQEVRPGSVKQYAKYFASALSTLPFIYNNIKND